VEPSFSRLSHTIGVLFCVPLKTSLAAPGIPLRDGQSPFKIDAIVILPDHLHCLWTLVEYIHYNPVKHKLAVAPIEWAYSSFGQYVQAGVYPADWGAAGPIAFPEDVGVSELGFVPQPNLPPISKEGCHDRRCAHTHQVQGRDPARGGPVQHGLAPGSGVKTPANWAEYMAAMEPVDRAIVFNIARLGEESPNDATAAFVRAYPEKLVGFLSVHPLDPQCLEEMERCVSDLGLKGLKLGPNYQNFDPLGEAAFRVYRRAEELGLPIVFHTGTSPVQMADLDYAHPRHFDRVAIAFRVTDGAGAYGPSLAEHDDRRDPQASSRLCHISALFTALVLLQLHGAGPGVGVLPKLLFGTDYLVSTPQENLDALRDPNRLVQGRICRGSRKRR